MSNGKENTDGLDDESHLGHFLRLLDTLSGFTVHLFAAFRT